MMKKDVKYKVEVQKWHIYIYKILCEMVLPSSQNSAPNSPELSLLIFFCHSTYLSGGFHYGFLERYTLFSV